MTEWVKRKADTAMNRRRAQEALDGLECDCHLHPGLQLRLELPHAHELGRTVQPDSRVRCILNEPRRMLMMQH